MKVSNTSQRLKEVMNKKGLKQVDILNKIQPLCKKYNIKMGSNDLSQYVTGKVEPSEKKLKALAEVLGTNEIWLKGYDVTDSPDLKILGEDDYFPLPMDIKEANIKKGSEIKVSDVIKLTEGLQYLNQEYTKSIKRIEILFKKLDDRSISDKELEELHYLFNERRQAIDNHFNEMIADIVVKESKKE